MNQFDEFTSQYDKVLLVTNLIAIIIGWGAFFPSCWAATKAAKVLIVRGKVSYTVDGQEGKKAVTKGEWLPEGSRIVTEDKSFTKLILKDNSTLNLAPKSEMVLSSMKSKEPGILSLVKGKIRAKVNNVGQNANKDIKERLYIRSKTATMGVRGTTCIAVFVPENDTFMTPVLSSSRQDSVLVIPNKKPLNLSQPEPGAAPPPPPAPREISKAIEIINPPPIGPAQVATYSPAMDAPQKMDMDVNQVDALAQNENLDDSKPNTETKLRDVAPPGVPRKAVINPQANLATTIVSALDTGGQKSEAIKEAILPAAPKAEVAKESGPADSGGPAVSDAPKAQAAVKEQKKAAPKKAAVASATKTAPKASKAPAAAVVADAPKPKVKAFIDLRTGIVIAPSVDNLAIDANSGVVRPSTKYGTFDEKGNYQAPPKLILMPDKSFAIETEVKVSQVDQSVARESEGPERKEEAAAAPAEEKKEAKKEAPPGEAAKAAPPPLRVPEVSEAPPPVDSIIIETSDGGTLAVSAPAPDADGPADSGGPRGGVQTIEQPDEGGETEEAAGPESDVNVDDIVESVEDQRDEAVQLQQEEIQIINNVNINESDVNINIILN